MPKLKLDFATLKSINCVCLSCELTNNKIGLHECHVNLFQCSGLQLTIKLPKTGETCSSGEVTCSECAV